MEPQTAFDKVAGEYDRTFTRSTIGKFMRNAVWNIMERAFAAGQPVLDMGCGTGEDALWLGRRGNSVTAIDAGAEMVRITSEKIRNAGLSDLVTVHQCRIEQLGDTRKVFDEITGNSGLLYQGVLSNFGALNCVDDLEKLSRGLAACIEHGGSAVFCLMGPWVPWEWIYYGSRFQFRKAARRLSSRGTLWRGMTIRYPSIAETLAAFDPFFRFISVTGVGFFIPPSYLEHWAERRPGIIRFLNIWERRLEKRWPFPWLADHYVLELKRR